jgi:hypothetical protein
MGSINVGFSVRFISEYALSRCEGLLDAPSVYYRYNPTVPCYVGHCHHDMAHPRVANGRDGLEI